MTWVRLDDNFADHPKVAKAGDMAGWLWVCGLAYCSRHLTDGFLPEAVVPRLTSLRTPEKWAEHLVNAGLWERVDGGYRVHDYLKFQFSSDEVRERRQDASLARREAGRRGGKQSGQARRSKREATAQTGEANAKQNASGNEATLEANEVEMTKQEEANAKQNEAPFPSPLRSPHGDLFAQPAQTRSKTPKSNEAKPPSDYQHVLDAYWREYEQATGKKPVIGPKEGKAAKDLLKVMSADEACATIHAAFRDDWFRTTGLELYQVSNSPNRWRGIPQSHSRLRASYVDPRRSLQPVDPNADFMRALDGDVPQENAS